VSGVGKFLPKPDTRHPKEMKNIANAILAYQVTGVKCITAFFNLPPRSKSMMLCSDEKGLTSIPELFNIQMMVDGTFLE
jgi:hypothetical protein